MRRRGVSGTADQNESPIAIAAVDIAFFVNLQPYPRMAQRYSAGNIGSSVASVAFLGGSDNFWSVDHARAISNGSGAAQSCKYQ